MSSENNKPVQKAQITVVYDDEQETFDMNGENTILEAALAKDLDVPFSCQGGVCTSCMAKIVEGNAVMDKNSVLTDDEIDEGIILTCQARPTTNKIVVDYDDV